MSNSPIESSAKNNFPWGSALITLLVFFVSSGLTLYFADQPILENYGFRQTQTALTSYWMIQEGWRLAYQTPIGGFPWSVPFELPIYQTVVALLAQLLHAPLEPTGRITSYLFLLACMYPAFQITRRLSLPRSFAWIFCSLLWSSPIYLFWGRSFMIETTAVFFTIAALPYAIDLCKKSVGIKSAFLFALFATLGMLQKITTTGPTIVIMALVILANNIRLTGVKIPPAKYIALVFVSFIVPVVSALLWTHYADLIKEKNALGSQLTSYSLGLWNYGTLDQRLSTEVLKTIFWDRILKDNAAGFFGVLLIVIAAIRGSFQTRIYLGISLLLIVTPILVFINLHFIHTYYQTSCVFFLIFALAVAVSSLSDNYKLAFIAPVLTILLAAANLYQFSEGYSKLLTLKIDPSNRPVLTVADVVDRYTPKDSGIVVFGLDWNSELAYYAKRKSFTVPVWLSKYADIWEHPANYLGGTELGAVVFCISGDQPNLAKILSHPLVQQEPHLFEIGSCYAWLPGVDSITLPGSDHPTLPIQPEKPNTILPGNYSGTAPDNVNCEGAIDVVNGAPPAAEEINLGGALFVSGWLAVSGKEGIAPEDIFVTLTDKSRSTKYFSAVKIPRIDLNEYFKNKSMPDLGYMAMIDTSSLEGEYVLGLAQGFKTKISQCTQFKIKTVARGGAGATKN